MIVAAVLKLGVASSSGFEFSDKRIHILFTETRKSLRYISVDLRQSEGYNSGRWRLVPVIFLSLYVEVYRSGHNGPDSRSGIRQRIVGSNPTASVSERVSFLGHSFQQYVKGIRTER